MILTNNVGGGERKLWQDEEEEKENQTEPME